MKEIDIKKVQPTKGYVLVEPSKAEEKTKSGIILSENDSEKPQYGVVLAVGESVCTCGDDCCESDDCCGDACDCGSDNCSCGGACDCKDEDSKEKSSCACDCSCGSAPVKVGDKVIYKKWGGNEFKVGDTEYQFLKFEDILAIIR